MLGYPNILKASPRLQSDRFISPDISAKVFSCEGTSLEAEAIIFQKLYPYQVLDIISFQTDPCYNLK